MAEITGWITVNGVHVPLMKGESKAKAVAKFIKDKKQEKKKKFENKVHDLMSIRRGGRNAFNYPEAYDVAEKELGYSIKTKLITR